MIKATRNNNGRYYVGNYFVTPITKEEYEEILKACGGKETQLTHGHVVNMHSAPKNVISKYAKKVVESHCDKSADEIEAEIRSLKSDLDALTELNRFIEREEMN